MVQNRNSFHLLFFVGANTLFNNSIIRKLLYGTGTFSINICFKRTVNFLLMIIVDKTMCYICTRKYFRND